MYRDMGYTDYPKRGGSFVGRITTRFLPVVQIVLFFCLFFGFIKPAISADVCGGDGWPCCIPGTKTDCDEQNADPSECECDPGFTCVEEFFGSDRFLTCLACGGPSQPACPISGCGGVDEPCCFTAAGAECENDDSVPGLTCVDTPSGSVCKPCGNEGDYCCGGGRDDCVPGQNLYCAPNNEPAPNEHDACIKIATGCGGTGDVCCTIGLPCKVYGDECQNGICVYVGLPEEPAPNPLLPYSGPKISSISALLAPMFKILYYVGIFVGILGIIYSGYLFISSEGDPGRVKEGKEQFTAAILGSLFVLLSVFILRVIINNILGIESSGL